MPSGAPSIKHLVLVLIALLSACSKDKPPIEPKAVVRIGQVLARSETVTLDVVGTVQLRRTAQLGFTTNGRVASILVDEGERVRRGQLIAALDATPVASSATAAEAEQRRARGELDRMSQLYDQGWVTKARLESAQAAEEVAVANLRATRFLASTARIYAAGDGIVLARLVEPGQVVAAGFAIVEMGDERGGFVLRAPVSDRDAAGLSIGAPATIRIAALGERAITGKLIEIGGRADAATGTFAVEVALATDAGLRAGQIGNLSITMSRQDVGPNVTVPPAAIFAPRAGEALVYIARPGTTTLRMRKVALIETRDDGIAVGSGLRPGEWVVISAVDRLRDGQSVTAIARGR